MDLGRHQEYIRATRLALGIYLTAPCDAHRLVQLVREAFPTLLHLEAVRAARGALFCIAGQGVPEQYPYLQGDEPQANSDSGPSEISILNELQSVMAERDEYKLAMDILAVNILCERIEEGRFFDDAESRVTPLRSAELVYRFANVIQLPPDNRLTIVQSDERLGVSKGVIYDALKVSYINRNQDDEFIRNLDFALSPLSVFVNQELFDEAIEEQENTNMPYGDRYLALLDQVTQDATNLRQDWRLFKSAVNAKMNR